jgi:hypothetical protein
MSAGRVTVEGLLLLTCFCVTFGIVMLAIAFDERRKK